MAPGVRGVVSDAWVVFDGVVKPYGGATPLSVPRLSIGPADRLVLSELDAGAAEMFTHLLTGAALPEIIPPGAVTAAT